MIQTVAIGAVALYLIAVAIAQNVQGLFEELSKEGRFVKWVLALIALKYIGDAAGDKVGDRLVLLVFLALFLSHSSSTVKGLEKIKGYFNG